MNKPGYPGLLIASGILELNLTFKSSPLQESEGFDVINPGSPG